MSSRASAPSGSLSHHHVTQRETLGEVGTGILLLSHPVDAHSQRYGQMLSDVF